MDLNLFCHVHYSVAWSLRKIIYVAMSICNACVVIAVRKQSQWYDTYETLNLFLVDFVWRTVEGVMVDRKISGKLKGEGSELSCSAR